MKRSRVSTSLPADTRAAEKERVRRMQITDHLEAKPFVTGTDLDFDHSLLEIAIFSAAINSLPCGPGSLVLDLGAGPSWVSEWLQKLRFRTFSLDLAEDMLRIGQKRLPPASWLCVGDMGAIPLRDQSVDAAISLNALHHVPNWHAALREVHRVLRMGGVLVLQEPGRGHHLRPESIAEMERFGVLEQELPPRTLARACRQAGFTRLIVRPVSEMGLGRSRILLPYPFWRSAPRVFFQKQMLQIKATVFEKMLNLISPLHLVVAMKGRTWADSRRPYALLARFRQVECPSAAVAGEPVMVRARILNNGLTQWLARTDDSCLGQVRLGISLMDAQSQVTDLDFARLDLPHDVEPGSDVEVQGEIPAFTNPGRVYLRFDLVAEGICWFLARGTVPYVHSLEVKTNTLERGER